MDKQYNVFISSTYDDLVIEREKIAKTLIAMNCMPRSMEYFYATDMHTWDYIKEVILSCDYYIIILAGRYGSICEQTGQSFTQMEYEFASKNNIPISRFLYNNPNSLSYDKHDKDINNQIQFEKFREVLQNGQIVEYWSTPDELACSVAISLHHFIIKELSNKNQPTNKKSIKDLFEQLDKIEAILSNNNNYSIAKDFKSNKINYFEQDNILVNDINNTNEILTKNSIDLLCEVANISLSCGFSALSYFLDNVTIRNSVPQFEFNNCSQYYIDTNNNQYYILFTFQGYVSGKILLNYKDKFIKEIFNILELKYPFQFSVLDDKMSNSILYELSSIFVGSSLTGLTSLFDIKIKVSDVYLKNDVNNVNIFKDDKYAYFINMYNYKFGFESTLILNDESVKRIMQIVK